MALSDLKAREIFLLVIGWAISMLALVLAAGVLLRTLNTQRAERLKLEARQQQLYESEQVQRPEQVQSPKSKVQSQE